MSDPTGIAPYLVANDSRNDLIPNARTLVVAADSGLSVSDQGPDNNFIIDTIEALQALNALSTAGLIVNTGTISPYFQTRSITSTNSSIVVTNPTGVAGNINLAVAPGTTVQSINYSYNTSTDVGTGSTLNLIAGDGIDITPSFDSDTDTASYTLSVAGGGGGTLSSVGIASTSGLLVTNSPLTSNGVIGVNLPTGTLNQVLAVTDISPYTLGFVNQSSGSSLATFLCQNDDDLPTNGINLGATNAQIGLGTETLNGSLHIVSTLTQAGALIETQGTQPAASGAVVMRHYETSVGNTLGSRVSMGGARGTIVSHTAVGNQDGLGSIEGHGYNGTDFGTAAASIKFVARETFTPLAQGSSIVFGVTPGGTNAVVDALLIDSNKSATFSGAVNAGFGGTFAGTFLGNAIYAGDLTFNGDCLFTSPNGTPITVSIGNGSTDAELAINPGSGLVTQSGSVVSFNNTPAFFQGAIMHNTLSGDFTIGGATADQDVEIGDGTHVTTILFQPGSILELGTSSFANFKNGSTTTFDAGSDLTFENTPTFVDGASVSGPITFTGLSAILVQSTPNFTGDVLLTGSGRVLNLTTNVSLGLDSDLASKPGVGGLWTVSSDIRIKDDIQSIENATDIINQLNPRRYKYTDEYKTHNNLSMEDKYEYGFVADEVEMVLPDCVTVSETSVGDIHNIKKLNMGGASALLFQAIKELSAHIGELSARIVVLESQT